MGSYIANFTVYTMAMLGLIFFALFVYKKFMAGGLGGSSSKFLSIEETMNINPRKSLLVVRAGNEKFLVASDVDRTTLISKLGDVNLTPKVDSFERFENIVQDETLIKSQPKTNRIVDSEVVLKEEEVKPMIHLEPIKEKKPSSRNLKRGMDRRTPQTSSKNVVLNFDKPTNHGLTTMKEMAKKINEL